uniref:Uncharacterized protein n=1 Tax=Pseudomonas putida (strain W619) TaxID=390235 RepID=B1J7Z9_PSEPW
MSVKLLWNLIVARRRCVHSCARFPTTRRAAGGYQYGTLQAHWGYGSEHDGQRFEVNLCEHCFFQTLAYLKQERRVQQLFSDEPTAESGDLGLVAQDDYFQDTGCR